MSEEDLAQPAIDQKLSLLGTKIELFLNPEEDTTKALLAIKDKIKRNKDIDGRNALDPELVSATQAILKAEWCRVKAELRPPRGSS